MKGVIGLLSALLWFTPVYAQTDAQAENANEIVWQEPNPDNLILLEIYLDRYNLNEVIPVYNQDQRYYIPLGAMSQIVGLSIQSNTETGTAEGYILEKNRRFWLDAKSKKVTISGQETTYEESEVVVYPDDIYVTAELLSKWFPYELDIDTQLSILIVKTQEKFPFQQKMERQQKMDRYKNRYIAPDLNYPEQKIPYQQYSIPFIDQSLSLSLIDTPSGGTSTTFSYTNYMTADLMNHQADMYLAIGNTTGVNDLRLTFNRKSPDADLMGGMKATAYSFGHVAFYGFEHTSLSRNSVIGGSFSTYPLNQQLEYDSHSFRGRLLPGWEVELYHNGNLVGYITDSSIRPASPDEPGYNQYFDGGEYVFESVPLIFGSNYFKLVFYGPHGEIIEEKQNFLLSSDMIRKGEQFYRVTTGVDENSGAPIMQAQYDVGIRKNVTINTRLETLPYNNIQHTYYSVGAASFFKSMYLKGAVTGDTVGGSVMDVHMQSRIMFMNIGLHYASVNGLESEHYTTPTDSVVELRLDTAIPKSKSLPRIPLVFELNQQQYSSGDIKQDVIGKMSVNQRGMSIINELTYSQIPLQPDTFTGIFQISRYKKGHGLRGEIYYQVDPNPAMTSLVLNYYGHYVGEYRTSFSISNPSAGSMQYVVAANKSRGKYSFTGQFSYKTTGEIALTGTMSLNMAQDPRTGEWVQKSTPLANKGAVSILVYYDANQNGKRDAGEEGIANAGFLLDGARRAYRTNQSGIAFITGLPVYRPMSIAIDLNTLEDPLWLPSIDGISIMLRPGATGQIEIPINTTGELDGIVYLKRNGKNIPLSGVEVQLVDKDGKVVQSVKTAYDGYYVISRVPVGQYRVRIAPEQLQNNQLRALPDKRVDMSIDNLFVNGIDFVIRRS